MIMEDSKHNPTRKIKRILNDACMIKNKPFLQAQAKDGGKVYFYLNPEPNRQT